MFHLSNLHSLIKVDYFHLFYKIYQLILDILFLFSINPLIFSK